MKYSLQDLEFGVEIEYQVKQVTEPSSSLLEADRENYLYRLRSGLQSESLCYFPNAYVDKVYVKIKELLEDEESNIYKEYCNEDKDIEVFRNYTIGDLIELGAIDNDAFDDYMLESYEPSEGIYDDIDESDIDLPNNWSWEHDGSVSGGELHFDKPLDFHDACKAVDDLHRWYHFYKDLNCNHECSGHVHVSIKGIKHQYGVNMQKFMLHYLLEHMHELEVDQLVRFQDSKWQREYFEIAESADKYTAIAYRKEHGTWEFRIFGNFQNADQAIKCMKMAGNALLYATEQRLTHNVCAMHIDDIRSSIHKRAKELLSGEVAA